MVISEAHCSGVFVKVMDIFFRVDWYFMIGL